MSETKTGGFSDAERAAMVERAKEAKAEKRRVSKEEKAALAEQDLLDKIAEMPESDRVMAERILAIVRETAPNLAPKTWYGMPAWTNADGKVVCFFRSADKFGSKYATLGFEEAANLDDGAMWPTSYALTAVTDTEAEKITALVKQAAS